VICGRGVGALVLEPFGPPRFTLSVATGVGDPTSEALADEAADGGAAGGETALAEEAADADAAADGCALDGSGAASGSESSNCADAADAAEAADNAASLGPVRAQNQKNTASASAALAPTNTGHKGGRFGLTDETWGWLSDAGCPTVLAMPFIVAATCAG
jgi:hypothetical protein